MKPTVGTRMDPDLVCRIDHLARQEGLSRSEWMKRELLTAVRIGEIWPTVLESINQTHGPGKGVNVDLGANGKLTPTQNAVYQLMLGHPDGLCRRDFALHDIWELSNRIGEIEDRLGIEIQRGRCRRHSHRHRVTLYRL